MVDEWLSWVRDTGVIGVVLIMAWKALKAVALWMQPRVDKFVDGHCQLMETLTARNMLQETCDAEMKRELSTLSTNQLSRTQAAVIGEHACDVLDAVAARMDLGDEVSQTVGRLRQAIEEMEDSDAIRSNLPPGAGRQ